jgi:hypothetical protein
LGDAGEERIMSTRHIVRFEPLLGLPWLPGVTDFWLVVAVFKRKDGGGNLRFRFGSARMREQPIRKSL